MKPFRFSLQSLRVLREQKERVAQKRYVAALRASDEAAARLDVASRELGVAWSQLCEELAESVSVGKLQQTRGWCGELEGRCEELAAALAAAEDLKGAAWREMLLATRERESLDKLREKNRRGYDGAVRREEQKQLDEMGLRLNSPAGGLCESLATSME